MATNIFIYTGNNCSKCMRAKEMFNNTPPGVEIELIELNVDENEAYKKHLTNFLQSHTLPTIVIEGEVYRGFDENIGKIMGYLGL